MKKNEQKRKWNMQNKIKASSFVGGLLIAAISMCCTTPDYTVRSRWVYNNETEYSISYSPTNEFMKFNILPFDSIVVEESGEGGKTITPESYMSPLRPDIIFYGESLCDTLQSGFGLRDGEGPRGMQNYASQKLSERYFKFVFRFTKENVKEANICK